MCVFAFLLLALKEVLRWGRVIYMVCLCWGDASWRSEDGFVDLKGRCVGRLFVNRETKEEGWSLSKEIKSFLFSGVGVE